MRLLPLLILATLPVWTQPTDTAMKEALAVQTFGATSISPDGKHLAWVETIRPRDGAIYLTDLPTKTGAKPRRITAGDGKKALRETAVCWSPDSTKLAFLSDAEKRGQ